MADYGDDNQQGEFGSGSLGNYQMNPHTGEYAPHGSRAVLPPVPNVNNNLQQMTQALMRGYERKQDMPGSYLPLTSVAPFSIAQSFAKPLDRYQSFGVPYEGTVDASGQSQYPQGSGSMY